MTLMSTFDVNGSAMQAQTVRLNLIASNVANAETSASSAKEAYRAASPVFETVLMNKLNGAGAQVSSGVRVAGIVHSQAEPLARYEPNNPMANEEGYVYGSNVNMVEEMANMVAASRNYQSNVRVMETSRQLLMRTLSLGE